MGFSKLLKQQDLLQEERAEYKAELEEQMLAIHDSLDSLADGEGWQRLLEQEQRQAFTDMMSGEGEQIILARERAKLVARILQKKKDWEDELRKLREERNSLED